MVLLFLFCFLFRQNAGKSAHGTRNSNAFILANLMYECTVIVENSRVQFLVKLSKYCA